VKAGEAVFAKCKSCHNADNGGANGTGPNLWGVEGRKPGSHAGFAYSPAMTEFGGKNPQWNYDLMYAFLKAPQKDVPGTKMTFVGLKKPEDRINLIAYLHGQGGTLPIPAPDPSRAPGAQQTAAAGAAAPAAGAAAPAAAGATAPAADAKAAPADAKAAPAAPAAAPATK
jgi:cytochrome c